MAKGDSKPYKDKHELYKPEVFEYEDFGTPAVYSSYRNCRSYAGGHSLVRYDCGRWSGCYLGGRKMNDLNEAAEWFCNHEMTAVGGEDESLED